MRTPVPKSPLLVALGVATLGPACLKLNPDYDSHGAVTDIGSTTADVTADAGSAGPTTGSTTASPTTGGLTTTGGTTDDPTTGGVDPASTGMSSETGDMTTGGPTHCWDQPLDGFTLSPLMPEAIGAGSPSLSPNGLSLFFRAPVPNYVEVRRLSRQSPADDFVGPAALFFGPPDTIELDYPEVVTAGAKIFFTQMGGEIYAARFENGMWKPWAVAGTATVFEPQHVESHPNATEDGTQLLFQRDDGPEVVPLGATFKFYQAALDVGSDSFISSPFEVTPTHPDLVIPVCPAMSPDGLHLLFAAKDAAADPQQFNDGSVGVWSAHRPAASAQWDPPTRSTVRAQGWITCPTSITADGCHATFIRFTYPGTLYEMHLGRRG
jgi:hypothetical protein